jgi:hypothetical protein
VVLFTVNLLIFIINRILTFQATTKRTETGTALTEYIRLIRGKVK